MNLIKELEKYVDRVNNALRRFFLQQSLQSTSLMEVMHYGALLGGKRLRPFLVYMIGRMFGIRDTTLDAPAAAMECVHAYSLIHDDLPAMDNNDLRRGKPTCHIRFGEAKAILAGDALQALAFSILSNAPMIEVADCDRLAMISELAMASGVTGMCGGQMLDLDAEDYQVSLKQLEQIHRYKTGSLIRSAVRLGALSAGKRGRDALPLLDQYAESIGLAFQVQDDILDVKGEIEKLGKHPGADQQSGKSTYPSLLGLSQAQHKARNLIDDAHKSLNLLAEKSLNVSALEELADYIIQRDK